MPERGPQPGGRPSRWVVAGAVVALVLTLAAPGAAATGPSIGGDRTVVPVADYATEYLGNPLDYSDAADLLTDGYATAGWGPLKGTSAPATFAGGLASWSMTSDGGWVFPVWMTFPGALPDAADGWSNPIDADRYRRVAIRLYSSKASTGGALDFWKCNEPLDVTTCGGRVAFAIAAGWKTYLVDFDSVSPQFAQDWSGDVIGLQVALNGLSGADVKLDWVRIYAPKPTIAVSASGQLGWDRDTSSANNSASSPDWGRLDTHAFDPGAFPPGTYHLFDANGYGDTITIAEQPLPRVLDPDAAGGDDFATIYNGDAWDFSQTSDVAAIGGSSSVIFSGGQLHATNASNDPWVQLPLSRPIDARRFHRVTVTTSYDGAFDLGFGPGGGTHGRLIFKRESLGPALVNSRELVTFTDRTTYTYDLTNPALRTTENDGGAAYVWDGSLTFLRWDPNEDPGSRRWRIDDLKVAADDTATPLFDVTWTDASAHPGTTVTIALDFDRHDFDGTLLATMVPQTAGTSTYRIDTTDLSPGTYWVQLTATDGTALTHTYSSGPLVIPDRLAGRGRTATSVSLSQAAYPGGNDEAIIADGSRFADALAGVQLAAAAGAPILLSDSGELSPEVATELTRLGVSSVYLLGGTSSLSTQVEADVEALGLTWTRLRGSGRMQTAVAVAEEAVARWKEVGVTTFDEVLVARAFDFPDALAAGQLVAAAKAPLVLVARDQAVPVEVTDFVAGLDPTTVTAIGGTGSVPEPRLAEAAQGRATDRVSGSGRHATAVAVRDRAVASGADPSLVVIASGRTFPDALAAGGLIAARGATLLTVERDALPDETRTALGADIISWYRIAGGAAAVSLATAAAIAGAI